MPALATLSSSLDSTLNEARGDVILTKLAAENDAALPVSTFPFQYFPETWSDSQEVNYNARDIPGGSMPIQQWINSGARVISFQAAFTCDVDLVAQGETQQLTIFNLLKSAGVQRRNVDLRTVQTYLRTYRLPTYGGEADTGAPLTLPPPKCVLTIPRSGIGLIGGAINGDNPLPDSIVSYMTQCEFNVMACFPSGLPRVMTADLAFTQTPQLAGTVQFPSAAPSPLVGSRTALPYVLEPRSGKGI